MAKSLFILEKDKRFGFKDINNKTIINPNYKQVKEFNKSKISWVLDETNTWNLITTNNNIIKHLKALDVVIFEDEYSFIQIDDKTILVYDHILKQDKIIDGEFIDFKNNTVLYKKNGFYYYYNINSEITSQPFTKAFSFLQKQFASVYLDDVCCVINDKYQVVIKTDFKEIYPIKNYFFKAKNKLDEEYFYDLNLNQYCNTNKQKDLVFSNHFANDLLVFYNKFNNTYGAINDWFEPVFSIKKIHKLFDFANNYAIYKKDQKYGLIKNNGDLITSNIFDEILHYDSDHFFVRHNNQYKYFDLYKKKLV